MYAHVAVETGSTSDLDALTYEVPPHLAGTLRLGSCVLVPLGSRQAVGYVIGFAKEPDVPDVRSIISELQSPLRLTEALLSLARWISEEYLCPLSHVVLSIIPAVMHYRVEMGVTPTDRRPDPGSLSPSEERLYSMLVAQARSTKSRSDADPETPFVRIESLVDGATKPAVLRIIRLLESKGFVRRVYRLSGYEGKPRVLRGVRVVGGTLLAIGELSDKQKQALSLIESLGRDVSIVELSQRFGISRSVVEALCRKGVLEPVSIVVRRVPTFARSSCDVPEKLTDDQQRAVQRITEALQAGRYRGFVLHGVTASGKTEVYVRCIQDALKRGRTCLLLLPEIAVTTQLTNVMKSRFGDEIAVLHSGLTPGERCDEWIRVQRGEARVVLGARSAVFAPLDNLGLVIVDEEHEPSYKQENPPRYNGRDVAVYRAKESNAVVVLGSATPSVETYYKAEIGEFTLIEMPTRVESRSLPIVRVVDLRDEMRKRRSSVFSEALEEAIREHLSRGHQVMLLQNRRAYSVFLLCRDCGYVPGCPNCAVTLKFRASQHMLTCHHCDYHEPAPDVCPKCGGHRIKRFGIGTERVEEETKKLFPDARVLRMDRDTTSRKGSHAAILSQFRKGEADILVGTQMIAKGLDFPNVTLVGVISADTALHIPDFRSSERTFQLVSQIAGRSGRGPEPGEVIVQTFDPENFAIRCAVAHDYASFYRSELEMRRELGYPPFTSMINVVAHDTDDMVAQSRLTEFLEAFKSTDAARCVSVAGPVRAVLAKLRGEYRWHAVLRSTERAAMIEAVRNVLSANAKLRRYLVVDVDPLSML
ncbi:MAG: primosomal protein N' [Armatimonadota bacterium]|nr:primosomal protein N' [Armatimonadota bacterium]